MTTSLRKWLTANAGTLWACVLVIGIIFQTGYLLREYALPWGWRVKQVWDAPRLVRSADLSLGAQARSIIIFVDQVVPEDAMILLPPGHTEDRFSLVRSMQYFFFPRHLIACADVNYALCRDALAQQDSYVLATEDFPPKSALQRAFVAPENGLGWFKGVYGPEFRPLQPSPDFRWLPWLGILVMDLSIILALAALGAAALLSIRWNWQPWEVLGLAVPAGAGLLTLCLFLLSWAGLKLNFGVAAAAWALLLAVVIALGRRGYRRFWQPKVWRKGWSGRHGMWRILIILGGLGLLGVAEAVSVGASYRLYDPVQIWSVKGYGIAHEGTIFAGANWGVHGLAYPLNIPLQIAIFFMADGDALPGSKLLFPLYGLALCTSVFAFLRRQAVDEHIAGLGAIFLGSVPIVFFHATSGFANLPFTAFLVAAALWGLEGIRHSSKSELLLSGLLLGLGAWTRPEGIFHALTVLIVIMAIVVVRRGDFSSLVPLFSPVIIIAGCWFIFSAAGRTIEGSVPQRQVQVYIAQTIGGQIDLSGLWTIISVFAYSMFVPYRAMFPAISATYWGALFVVALGILVVSVGRLSPRANTDRFCLVVLTGCLGLLTTLEFYIQSYSMDNFPALIERAFPRAALPVVVLIFVLALWSLSTAPMHEERSSSDHVDEA